MPWKRYVWSGIALVLAGLILGGCQPVEDPWVSGSWGEQLAAERTRTQDQQHELRARLRRYGSAYQ